MKWYCKYCDKEMNKTWKKHHVGLKSHKTKAEMAKYFREIDERLKPYLDDYESGKISILEYDCREQDIYNEINELDDGNYFKNLADSDYNSEEDKTEDGERPVLRRRSKSITENKKNPLDEFKSAFDEWSDEEEND